MLISQTSDVQFIFDVHNDVIKIPANKAVLAASSSVFGALFNDRPREMSNMKIIDASPVEFKEFLQFFYGQNISLTMENIAVVLMLIDKYRVGGCLDVCVRFLKESLTVDNVFWCLHLAINFNLDDLKTHCYCLIQWNYLKVIEKLNINSNGKLYVTSNNRLMDFQLENILPHVIMALKNGIVKFTFGNIANKIPSS